MYRGEEATRSSWANKDSARSATPPDSPLSMIRLGARPLNPGSC